MFGVVIVRRVGHRSWRHRWPRRAHDREGDRHMNDAMKLDLDLSALPLDDFEVVDEGLTVESLTASQTFKTCDCSCCHFCACPCVCC
jgi:hypothetical protein